MNTSLTKAQRQIDQLTFTRFVAALTVIYFHYGRGTFPFTIPWVDSLFLVGNISVSYFYSLSGFIMTVVYCRERSTHFQKVRYWQARLARIYPVYILALTATIMLMNPQRHSLWKKVYSFFMIQSWIPGYAMSYNFPGWSVSVEVFFYLLFPFLVVAFARTGLQRLCIAVCLFWTSSHLLHITLSSSFAVHPSSALFDFLYYLPWLHLNAFLCGMLCGVIYLRHGWRLAERGRINTALLAGAALLIVLVLLCRKVTELLCFHLTLTNGILAPLFLVLIHALSCDRTFISRWLSTRPCVMLGDASYSMYILHVPIFLAFQKVTAALHLTLTKSVALHVYALTVVALSVVSYLAIERPARKSLKRLFLPDARHSEKMGDAAPIPG